MSKLQEIKAAQLAARKTKDTVTAYLLTTLIGEIEMVAKNESREVTDEDTLKVLKKFEKGMKDTIGFLNNNKSMNDEMIDVRTSVVQHELQIINQFLPSKISDADIQQDIATIMLNKGLTYEQKSLGVITKELRVKYGDQFDGQQISDQFKQMLT